MTHYISSRDGMSLRSMASNGYDLADHAKVDGSGRAVANKALDAIDVKILAALQANARLTNVELAEMVGLSPSPCLRRVNRLEREGIITAYRAVVDRGAAGLPLTVFVEIKVGRHSLDNADAVGAALSAIDNVVSVHMVSGAADFLAEIVVADLSQYERLLSERLLTLQTVADIRSNFSLRRIKSDSALPIGEAASGSSPNSPKTPLKTHS
jgi:Lrp/AsnC family leucine-responsive transcriptional regulator